jgi:hypothetical protein
VLSVLTEPEESNDTKRAKLLNRLDDVAFPELFEDWWKRELPQHPEWVEYDESTW